MAFPGILFNKRCNQCCKCCKDQCNNDFKKVLDLKNSGLVVYLHHRCKEIKSLTEDKYDAVILFNNTNKHHKRSTLLSELGQHNVRCFKCKNIIQRVRNLLAEIKCIKANQTIGVCDYCKKANISNCKRCEYIVSKFMTSNADAEKAMVQYLIAWVRKVMISLQFSVEGCISKHNLNIRDNCVEELQRLLNKLESPLSIRQPDYYSTLINKVMTSLQSVLEGFLDKYKLNAKDASAEELQRLLIEFKTLTKHAPVCHPKIECFPIVEEIKSLDNLKVMELLEKLMSRFNNESEISSSVSDTATNFFTKAKDSTQIIEKTSCDNISFEENKNSALRALRREMHKSMDIENIPLENKPGIKGKGDIKLEKENKIKKDQSIIKRKDKISKLRDKNIDDTSNRLGILLKGKNKKGETKTKVATKNKKEKHDKENEKDFEELMMKKIMQKEGKNKVQRQQNQEKPLPKIKVQSLLDLPIHLNTELKDSSSSSVFECEDTKVVPNVMIKRQHIIPLNPHHGKQDGSATTVQYQVLNSISDTLLEAKITKVVQGSQEIQINVFDTVADHKLMFKRRHVPQEQGFQVPLLYHVYKNISSHSLSNLSPPEENVISTALPNGIPTVKDDKSVEASDKGVIRYQLSDPECITKGWTKLPSLRIMRKINIYRMKPVNAANNWFERNKKSTVLYNGSDEKLADIDELGYGKLYYKNGRIALDYYKAKEPNVIYRYIIYSDGEPINGVPKPITILGILDGTGCCVVYDNYGRERLKYNQSEGMVIDKAVDSPCRWKWHTLNEPPVLQPVFVDTYSKDTSTRKLIESENGNVYSKDTNVDMLEIELENFLKEKADKLLQKFKPLEIKSKTLKLNQQFSLQICNQTVVYLVFREGRTSLKLNLGLKLVNNEIVGTESQDAGDLFTSYDRFPPRSESLENIQQMLDTARNFKTKNKNVLNTRLFSSFTT